MYCLKCKQKTESKNITKVISKNNRIMLKGICVVCGCKKSAFTKNDKSGTGIGDTIINAIGKIGELHLPATNGEYVPNGSFNNQLNYSYCGPGTKYDQRVREGYKGINELDSMCKLHDKFYNENTDTSSRNISDIALAHRANEIANDSRFDSEQRKAASLVATIMENKAKFGLGVKKQNSKNLKKGPMKKK
jgi:Domain of unknown function (DUF5679)/Phospholipase A2-like domain